MIDEQQKTNESLLKNQGLDIKPHELDPSFSDLDASTVETSENVLTSGPGWSLEKTVKSNAKRFLACQQSTATRLSKLKHNNNNNNTKEFQPWLQPLQTLDNWMCVQLFT